MKNKNIFLISTDKESNLWKNHAVNKLIFGQFTSKEAKINCQNQFIYITNTEDIKENDYCYCDKYNIFFKYLGQGALLKSTMKVCITNDTSLVEDGVQQVSSSFLSFFAENQPDYVEVESNTFDTGDDTYFLIFPQKIN